MTQNVVNALPKNQAFLDYLKAKQQGGAIATTKSGKHLGGVPPIFELPKYDMKDFYKDMAFSVSYDLRTEGRVTSVKDQNPLGTCWAFATFGSLESNLLPSEYTDFSENNLINKHGFDFAPDAGGNPTMSQAYLARWSGPMAEQDDPYTGQVHPSPPNISPTKHVQEIRLFPARQSPTDNDSIKYALMNHGAIDARMYWDDNYFNPNSAAYYYNITGSGINHEVTIIGWDDNYASTNFKIYPPGNGAFIVKNSWGTEWGQGGYFYISYYDQAFFAAAVYTVAEALNNFKDIYQYDTLGFEASLYYTNSSNIWMANMFTAASDDPIAAVSFYTLFPSTECTIEIYTNCSSTPDSGYLLASKSFVSDILGYQTVRLDNLAPITKGTKFSIAINLTVPEGYISYAAAEERIDGFSSGVTINPGESFLSMDKTSWYDLSQLPPYGNVCLKAFTASAVSNTIVGFDPPAITIVKEPSSEYSDEFTVNTLFKSLPNGQSVLGFHNTISFDVNYLQAVKCEVASDCLLNPIIGEPIIDIDNIAGSIDFNLARSDSSYSKSDGVVYKITFKAKVKGTTNLIHLVADLRDDQGKVIPVTTENCTVNIVEGNALIGDFNYDNKIDFEDLLLFAKAWNHKLGDAGWDNVIPSLYGSPYKEKDIGPATGTPPNLIIAADNIVDIKDYSVFVEMWKWIRGQNSQEGISARQENSSAGNQPKWIKLS